MKWEEDGIVPRRAVPRKAGEQGLLCTGHAGRIWRRGRQLLYSAIMIEEQGRAIASGPAFSLHNDIVGPSCCVTAPGAEARREQGLPGGGSDDDGRDRAQAPGSNLQGIERKRGDEQQSLGDQRLEDLISNRPLRRPRDRGRRRPIPRLERAGTSLIVVDGRRRGVRAQPRSSRRSA